MRGVRIRDLGVRTAGAPFVVRIFNRLNFSFCRMQVSQNSCLSFFEDVCCLRAVYSKLQFLVLELEHINVVGRRALHLYAVKRAYDTCRNRPRFDCNVFIKVYQSALISIWAKNQCTDLMCKSLIFGPPPALAQVEAETRPLVRVSGSVQTVLPFQPRSSL